MQSQLQIQAARKNIKKAQAAWKSMSYRQHGKHSGRGEPEPNPEQKGRRIL